MQHLPRRPNFDHSMRHYHNCGSISNETRKGRKISVPWLQNAHFYLDLVGHRVFARREGRAVILKCEVCAEEMPLQEGHLDEMNEFILGHRDCGEEPTPTT